MEKGLSRHADQNVYKGNISIISANKDELTFNVGKNDIYGRIVLTHTRHDAAHTLTHELLDCKCGDGGGRIRFTCAM